MASNSTKTPWPACTATSYKDRQIEPYSIGLTILGYSGVPSRRRRRRRRREERKKNCPSCPLLKVQFCPLQIGSISESKVRLAMSRLF
jgi:hypothetical protein